MHRAAAPIALSDAQLFEDCALPGGYTSGAYSTGWATILRRFATAAEAALSGSPIDR